jgi:hypothetical protein
MAQWLIRGEVRAGVATNEEILNGETEAFENWPEDQLPKPSDRAIREIAESEIELFDRVQARWPQTTDIDRLHAVFEKLRGRGYLTAESYEHCDVCALTELETDAERKAKDGKPVRGIVFYSESCARAAARKGRVAIHVHPGSRTGPPAKELMREVRETIVQGGFQVQRTKGNVLQVPIQWRKRR